MKIIMIALSLSFFGCSHTRIKSWQANQVTVCGNKWAKQSDFEKQVATRCPAFTAIGGGESETGDIRVMQNEFFGSSVRTQKEQCVIYQCN